MWITESILLYQLSSAVSRWPEEDHPSMKTYEKASLYKVGQGLADPNTIWVCDVNDFLKCDVDTLKGLTLAPVGNGQAMDDLCEKIKNKNCVLFFFPYHYSVSDVLSELSGVFHQLNSWAAATEIAAYINSSVQGILDLACEVTDVPMLIWAPNFSVIAHINTARSDIPPPMQEVISSGYYGGNAVNFMLHKRDYLTSSERYYDLRLIPPPNYMSCYDCAKCFLLGNKIVMTFGAYFLDGKPHPGLFELIRVLTEKIQLHISFHKDKYGGKKKLYESFFLDLLEERITTKEDICDRLQYINLSLSGKYQVILTEFSSFATIAALGIGRDIFKQIFPKAKVVEYKGKLIVLLSECGNNEEFSEYSLSKFGALTDSVSAGSSRVFYSLLEMKKAYHEAWLALQYGKLLAPDKHFYSYARYGIYHLIESLAESGDRSELKYPSDLIFRLREADQTKKNNNEELLRTYLSYGRNAAAAAAHLNLHRNSILYRIKQIETFLHIDMNNSESLFDIILSLKAVDLLDAKERNRRQKSLEQKPTEEE